MPTVPVVITKVLPANLAATIQGFGDGFIAAVKPDENGTFTLTMTPITAAGAAAHVAAAPAAAPATAAASPSPPSPPSPPPSLPPGAIVSDAGPESDADYLDLLPLPPKSTFNAGLQSTGQHRLLDLLGEPVLGGHYDPMGQCMSPDNPEFRKRLVLQSVGPFKVTGVGVAVKSLAQVLQQVKVARPRLFGMLASNGMECARFTKVNGKIGPGVSTHAWGMAIDFKIGGKTDTQGDGRVLRGSLELSRFFNAAEWYWGAGFPTEDGMHFEASASLVERWKADGSI